MSIYGAMYSGVSGLFAQSQALGMISDNISNVNTIGYKGTQARFSTMVTQAASANHYSPGGVRSHPFQGIDRQGLIQGGSRTTDLAVSGNGFFVVNQSANPGFGDGYAYTRAGGFEPDENGFLRNTANYYLQGWRLNPDGSLADGVNQNVLTGLETVNISNLAGSVRATTEMTLAANLPADAMTIDPAATTTLTLNGNLQRSATLPNSASQTITVYDDNGDAYEVDVTYDQTAVGASGGATVDWDVSITDIRDADGNSVYTAGTPTNVGSLSFDYDDGTLTTPGAFNVNLAGLSSAGTFSTAIAADATTVSSTAGDGTIDGTADGAPNLANAPIGNTYPMSVQIFDSLGVAYNLALRYVKNDVTIGTPSTSSWSVYVQDLTRVSDGTRIAGAPADPDDPGTWGAPIGSMTFGSDGKLLSTSAQPNAAAGDALSLNLDLGGYALTNGATWGDNGAPLTINIGRAETIGGMQQVATEYEPRIIEQDGVQYGKFIGVEIDEAGIVTAKFDNGELLPIYQIPLATFPNANGLEAQNGNVFIQTNQSGDYFLRAPGSGGAGLIASEALESSTVDLATEFTNMIVTQRAYSASSKVITTADEMLDELVRIKR